MQVGAEAEPFDEQLAPGIIAAYSIIAGVNLQGPVDGEKVVGDELLVHDAHQTPSQTIVAHRIVAEDAHRAAINAGDAADHINRGALAGTVGAE